MAILNPSTHPNAHPPAPFRSLLTIHHFMKKVLVWHFPICSLSYSRMYWIKTTYRQNSAPVSLWLVIKITPQNHKKKKRFWVALYERMCNEEGVWQFKISNKSTFLDIYEYNKFKGLAKSFKNNTQKTYWTCAILYTNKQFTNILRLSLL